MVLWKVFDPHNVVKVPDEFNGCGVCLILEEIEKCWVFNSSVYQVLASIICIEVGKTKLDYIDGMNQLSAEIIFSCGLVIVWCILVYVLRWFALTFPV